MKEISATDTSSRDTIEPTAVCVMEAIKEPTVGGNGNGLLIEEAAKEEQCTKKAGEPPKEGRGHQSNTDYTEKSNAPHYCNTQINPESNAPDSIRAYDGIMPLPTNNGTLRRSNGTLSSNNQPGAYPSRPGQEVLSRNVTGHVTDPSALPEPEPELRVPPEILSEARIVNLAEADQVDLESLERRAEEQRKERKRQFLCYGTASLVVMLVLVMAVVVGIILAKGSESNTGVGQATSTPISEADLLFSLLPEYSIEAIRKDEAAPQALAFDWLLDDPGFLALPDWRKLQRFALATFYFATGGPSWLIQTNWLSYNHSTSECEWFSNDRLGPMDPETIVYGLVSSYPRLAYQPGLCDDSNTPKVERLVSFANNLQGTLPPQLSLLTSLRLFGMIEKIGGVIPSEIGQLSTLEFFAIVHSKVHGTVPSEVANIRNLTHFMLPMNRLSGVIPTQLGTLTNLKGLMLDLNQLEGTLPTELGLLSNALWVSSVANQLTGTIPTQLGQLSSVRFLGINNNHLRSSIPSELGLLRSMQHLNIEGGQVSGTIPTEVGQLSALKKLYLPWSPGLFGTIPSQLGRLEKLWYIDLGNSSIAGTIPLELWLAPSLKKLYLYQSNLISGSLPTEIGLASTLEEVSMRYTDITGSIPTEIGLASNLQQLDWRYSQRRGLNGPIPSEIGLLSKLWRLQLDENEVTGETPTEIGNALALVRFTLSGNDVGGALPSELAMLSNLRQIDFEGNKISGTIPAELQTLSGTGLEFLNVSNMVSLVGTVPEALCDAIIFNCSNPLCGCNSCPC